MADIKIDEEMLLRAGLGIGYAFAPFFRGILEGSWKMGIVSKWGI